MKCLIYVIVVIRLIISEEVRYDNFTLLSVNPPPEFVKELDHLRTNAEILSYSRDRNFTYQLLVPPRRKTEFYQVLNNHNFFYKVIHENIQELLDNEKEQNRKMADKHGVGYGWKRFYSYEETNSWMMSLQEKYPGQVSFINIGKSSNNLDTYGLKISKRSGNRAIFIESGIHAREWIGPATSTFIMNELLTSDDPDIRSLSENYDWFFVPIVNPDGYKYSQINRLWRKNLRKSDMCYGVDLNRNWDYHWSEAGSSKLACSEVYAGPKPNSEPETQNLANFIRPLSKQIELYIAFHSYSQLLIWPEGYTSKRIPEYDNYETIGKATIEGISKKYGTVYTMGGISEAIYPAAGDTIDYMRSVMKIPLAFCFELRPTRESGGLGFVLPMEEIEPTGRETLDGISAMIKSAKSLGYFKENL